MDAIRVSKLVKQYKSVTAVNSVSFSVKKGEIFGLLGPNGAGKTTTINCMIGLAVPTSGSIKVFGHDVVRDYVESRLQIGVSPQDPVFDYYFGALETLTYQGAYFGLSWSESRSRAESLLKRFNLWEKRKATHREISGGMKRKLSIAKALMHNPKILVLDEPTAALDVHARHELWEFVRSLRKEGTTIILTTHYIEEAEKLADRICIINKGSVVKLEKTKKLMDDLSRNVIKITLKKDVAVSQILNGLEHDKENNTIRVFVAQKDQNRVLREVLRRLDENSVEIENFGIQHDNLENIFRRIIA